MDDPEQAIRALESVIGTMTETQVLHGLRVLEAYRDNEREMLGRLKSVSLVSTEDSADEIDELKSDLNLYRRPSVNAFPLMDYFHEALKKRLETLRKRPDSNS
jgi:hypothetical protein